MSCDLPPKFIVVIEKFYRAHDLVCDNIVLNAGDIPTSITNPNMNIFPPPGYFVFAISTVAICNAYNLYSKFVFVAVFCLIFVDYISIDAVLRFAIEIDLDILGN